MSGVETTLKRRFGVTPQVSMDDAVIWIRWDKVAPPAPWRVYAAVVDGGMGLSAFHVLGSFTFRDGHARTGKKLDFDFDGKPFKAGKWDVEITGYEKKNGHCKVHAVKPYFEPKVYTTDS